MAHQKIWNFNNELNFDTDLAKVGFTDRAKLILIDNPGLIFTEDCADDTDWTYGSSKAEFVAGSIQQKDFRPTGALFYADYEVNKDANWSNGTNTGTLLNGATIANGFLNCKLLANKACSYSIDSLTTLGNTGCIRMRVKPNFTGTPSRQMYLIAIGAGANELYFLVNNNGRLSVVLKNSSGTIISTIASALSLPWNSSNITEIEYNWDITTGAQSLYIDGAKDGSDTAIGTRTAPSGSIYVGNYSNLTASFDGEVDIVAIFNTVQHTGASYTPENITPTIYAETVAEFPPFDYSGVGSIRSVDDVTITFSGLPRFVTGSYYHDGSAWVVSDDSYAQANTPAEFAAQVINLPVEGAGSVTMKVVFPESNNQSVLDLFSLEITGQIYSVELQTVEPNEGQLCDGIDDIQADTNNITDDYYIKYITKKDSDYIYHNGTSWVDSDKSLSQLNTVAEILANKTALDLENNPAVIKIIPVLISVDGLDTPEILSIEFDYNYFKQQDTVNKCKISGYLSDLGVTGIDDDSEIRIYAKKPFEYGDNTLFTHDKKIYTTTKNNRKGWFEVYLPETETIEKTLNFVIPIIDKDGNLSTKTYKNLTIPNKAEEDFNTLITA